MASKLNLTFSPGTYFAGVDIPWYVPNSMIVDRLMKEPGVKGVWIYPRKGTRLPVNPYLDRLYNDDWQEWIRLKYDGPVRVLRSAKQWAWMVSVPKAIEHQLPAFVPPPASYTGKGGSSASSWASSGGPMSSGTTLALMLAPAALLTLALALRGR